MARNNARKLMTVGVTLVVIALTLSPARAAFDDFDGYEVGRAASSPPNGAGGGASGGVAWTSNWYAQNGSSTMVADDLGAIGGEVSQGPSVQLPAGSQNDTGRNFTPVTTGTLYVSAMMEVAGAFTSANGFGGLRVVSDQGNAILFGQGFNATQWGASSGGSSFGVDIQADVPVLMVAKIDVDTKEVTAWLNPDLTLDELDAYNVAASQTYTTSASFSQLQAIAVESGISSGANTWRFDNVNVSTQSLFLIPEPTATLCPGLSGGLLLIRRR